MTSQVSVDSQRMSLESQLRDKVRELNEYQAKYDAHSAEMKARYSSRCQSCSDTLPAHPLPFHSFLAQLNLSCDVVFVNF